MFLPDFFQFSVPTHIIFGDGISNDFSAELARLNVSRIALVGDRTLAQSGMLTAIRKGIESAGVAVAGEFLDIPPISNVKVVRALAFEAKQWGADGFVAVGGGTILDTTKAANILLTHGGDLVGDYSGAQTLPGVLRPLVAIPTTAGTGSEVTQAAVIYDDAQKMKLSFVDLHLRPALAVLDPLLTVGLPPRLTAATGMDTLTHAIEAWTSIQSNPFSNALALHAIRLVMRCLLPAVIDGSDLAARKGMMTAATMAGVAFDHAMVGVVHAMSHAVEAVAHVHHGTANSILLPWGMEYNREVCADKYAELGPRMGVANVRSVDAVINQVKALQYELRRKSGLPMTLSEAGVTEAQLPQIAALAVQDGTCVYNPRDVDEEELLRLLRQAL
jgi:alcohol dehydrogenase class IV